MVPNIIEYLYNKASSYAGQGQYDKAVEFLQQGLTLNPNLAHFHGGLGSAYISLGQYEKAIESSQKALDLDANIDFIYFNLGLVYDHLEQYDKAVEHYQKAIDRGLKVDQVYFNLALAYESLGQYDKTVDSLHHVLDLNPNFNFIYFNLGLVYTNIGQYDKAVEYLQKAIDFYPPSAQFHLEIGIVYSKLRQLNKAIESFQRALDLDSNLDSVHYWLGITYSDLGQYDKAVEQYQKAIDIDLKVGYVHSNLGFVYEKLGQYDKAIESLQKALDINPFLVMALINMGLVYNDLGNYPKAIQYSQKAIELEPNLVEPYRNMSNSYEALGNYTKAIECYQQIIKLNPNSLQTYINIGLAYNNLKQYSVAIDYFLHAIEYKSDMALPYLYLGIAYANLTDYNKAIKYYKRAIKLDSSLVLAYNHLGEAYGYIEQYNDAIKCLKQAIELDPTFPYSYNNLGLVFFKIGNYTQAIKSYKQAIDLNSHFAVPHLNTGIAYAALEQFNEAIEHINLAIQYDYSLTEAYYWLGKIYVDTLDFSRARANFTRFAFLIGEKNPYIYELLAFFRDKASSPFVTHRLFEILRFSLLEGHGNFVRKTENQCQPIVNFLDYLLLVSFEDKNQYQYTHIKALCHYFMGDFAEAEYVFDYEIDSNDKIEMRIFSYYYHLKAQMSSALPDSYTNPLKKDLINEAEAILSNPKNRNSEDLYYSGLVFYQYLQDLAKAYQCFKMAKDSLPARYMLWLIESPENRPYIKTNIEELEARLLSTYSFVNGLIPQSIGSNTSSYWAAIQHYCFYQEIKEIIPYIYPNNQQSENIPFYKYWSFNLTKEENIELANFRTIREREKIYNLIENSINSIKNIIDNQTIEKNIVSAFTTLMREFKNLQKDADVESGELLENHLALHIYSTARLNVFDAYNIKGLNFLEAHQLIALYFFSLGKINARTTAHLIFYTIYTTKIVYPQLLGKITKEGSVEGIIDDIKGSEDLKNTGITLIQTITSTLSLAYGTFLCVFFISFTVKALLMIIQERSRKELNDDGAVDYQLFIKEFGSKLDEVKDAYNPVDGLDKILNY